MYRCASLDGGIAWNLRFCASVNGRSGRGTIHGAVRWKTVSREVRAAIWGTNWIADAPVPITATRLPVRS